MTLAELVPLALKVSIMTLVFTIGLGTPAADLSYFVRKPWELVRSVLAMSVVMPIIVVALVVGLDLRKSVEISLVALALAPIPPILPKRLIKAGGDHAYIMCLLCVAALLSIVIIPLASALLDAIFPAHLAVAPGPVAGIALTTVLLPMIAGVLVRHFAPTLAARAETPLSLAANVLLMIAVALVLVKIGPMALAQLGNGTLLAIVAFVILGLAVGHILGPPTPGGRTVLALATATRHPAMAIAIARLNFPDEKAVPATVLLYLLVGLIVSTPYMIWRTRVIARQGATAA